MTAPARLLITAGPTHEPIDAVRYLGNRSSGRLGVALADAAAERGHTVTLLLGPTPRLPSHPSVRTLRFQTAADLEHLLQESFPECDILIMAAAVADYRPAHPDPAALQRKVRRKDGPLRLELAPTPDLLAGCAARRRAGQCLVGFALEPRAGLFEAARAKLERKGIDLIVANPLETMDSDHVEATMLGRPGTAFEHGRPTPGVLQKEAFAGWLLDAVAEAMERRSA